MAFKFGPRHAVPVAQPAPANYGRANTFFPAQQELDWTAARASAQYMEALAVDGIDMHYWKRSREGRFCTCQTRQGFRADADPPELDEPPAVRVRHASSILGTANPRMRITDGPFGGTVIGDLPEAETGNVSDDTGNREQDVFNYITEPGDDDNDGDNFALSNDDFLNNPDAGVVFGGEKSPCGICFKSAHVGGYQLLQGTRIVLETSGEYPMDLQGFAINDDARPFEFTSAYDPSNSVSWIVEIPKYFEKLCAAVTRNNLVPSRDTLTEFKPISGGSYAPLTPEAMNAYKGVGGKFIVRVRPKARAKDGVCAFTHVELVFQTVPWIKGQIAPLTKSTNFAIFNGLQTRIAEMVLPPTLPNVANEDVILDQKYGILWKITNVTDFMTSTRQIMGWTATAREVHPDEMTYLLKVTHVPYVELNYAGFERIQGQNITTDDRF